MVCTAVGIPWTSNVKCICNYPRWPGDQGEQRQKLLLRDSPCPPGPGSRAGSWLLESPGAACAAARAAGCAAAHCTDGSQLPCSSPGQARLTHELSRCPGRAGKEGRKGSCPVAALLAQSVQRIAFFLWFLGVLSFDFYSQSTMAEVGCAAQPSPPGKLAFQFTFSAV